MAFGGGPLARCPICKVRATHAGASACKRCRRLERLAAAGAHVSGSRAFCRGCRRILPHGTRSPDCRSCGRKRASLRAGLSLRTARERREHYDPSPAEIERVEARLAWLAATRRLRPRPTLSSWDAWARPGDPLTAAPSWGW